LHRRPCRHAVTGEFADAGLQHFAAVARGYAGVCSSFPPHAERAARRYHVPAHEILQRVAKPATPAAGKTWSSTSPSISPPTATASRPVRADRDPGAAAPHRQTDQPGIGQPPGLGTAVPGGKAVWSSISACSAINRDARLPGTAGHGPPSHVRGPAQGTASPRAGLPGPLPGLRWARCPVFGDHEDVPCFDALAGPWPSVRSPPLRHPPVRPGRAPGSHPRRGPGAGQERLPGTGMQGERRDGREPGPPRPGHRVAARVHQVPDVLRADIRRRLSP